jgi:hypothetical protein
MILFIRLTKELCVRGMTRLVELEVPKPNNIVLVMIFLTRFPKALAVWRRTNYRASLSPRRMLVKWFFDQMSGQYNSAAY